MVFELTVLLSNGDFEMACSCDHHAVAAARGQPDARARSGRRLDLERAAGRVIRSRKFFSPLPVGPVRPNRQAAAVVADLEHERTVRTCKVTATSDARACLTALVIASFKAR